MYTEQVSFLFLIYFHPLGFAFSFRLRSSSFDGTSRPNKAGAPEVAIGPRIIKDKASASSKNVSPAS
jgi:hypothetical protein